MGSEQVTRRVYSAEQLHRLRVSCSQPKLSEAIEEHDGDDAELIKEHVLRGAKSFPRSFRSRTSTNSFRVPSNKENRSTADAENSNSSSGNGAPINAHLNNPVLGEISANPQIIRPGIWKIRPSPTPSLKKKKAEAIVKLHGSPQHVRVTAGGRIVPSEQSPLCHPRYGYSAIKMNGGLIKFSPNYPVGKEPLWDRATQNGFIAQDVNGRLCQIVNGDILPLKEENGSWQLYIEAPNVDTRGLSAGPNYHSHPMDHNTQQRNSSLSKPRSPPEPSLAVQLDALEKQYKELEREQKELNQADVLAGRTMPRPAKEAVVAKRRELVGRLDDIRKKIKSIKAAGASASQQAPSGQRPSSASQPAVPNFIQQRMRQAHDRAFASAAPPHGPFYGFAGSLQYGPEFGFQAPQMVEPAYVHAPYQAPMFVPPPAFDGSVAASFGPFANPSTGAVANHGHSLPQAGGPPQTLDHAVRLPQTDGAGSIKDGQRVTSPARPHAVDIKAPELKQGTTLKSNLNPMSPAYKPGGGVLQNASNADHSINKLAKAEKSMPLSSVHQLKPLTAEGGNAVNGSEETISPTKKSPHLHSSSVSSFETADFFPRNTKEYSTRKYAYPEPVSTEDKENISPNQSVDASEHSASMANHVAGKEYVAPAPPPSTPAGRKTTDKGYGSTVVEKGSAFSQRNGHAFDSIAMPDRQAHNVSPKNRRSDHIFIYEDPSQLPSLPSSSPQKCATQVKEHAIAATAPADKIDYSQASVEWIEGYRAGLARKPIEADHVGDFLHGYCEGLLKSKRAEAAATRDSSTKPSISRRPSPAIIQSGSTIRTAGESQPSPFENRMTSMDTLKEAVFAPANENTILSPSVDGPHINETALNLGAWAKSHDVVNAAEASAHTSGDGLAGYPFPRSAGSMVRRQGIMSEDDLTGKTSASRMGFGSETFASPQAVFRSELPAQTTPDAARAVPANRVVSLTGLDSSLYNQWPGTRLFSGPLDWKSSTSIAQAVGLASGHFAQPASERGADVSKRDMSMLSNSTMHNHSRFHEGSLDGITNPPNSPQLGSPPMSPSLVGGKKSSSSSPAKGVSPTKVKFESMAEKVGIKVSSGSKKDKHHGSSPTGAAGKRGWFWPGTRKDVSKGDDAGVSNP